MKMRGEMCFIK